MPTPLQDNPRANLLSLEKNALRMSFPYDPKKLALLRRIRSARFEKETKTWTLALADYPKLKKLKLFSRKHFRYDFTENEIAERIASLAKLKDQALSRLKQNPFSLSAEDIAVLEPSFVFYLKNNILYLKTAQTKLVQELGDLHFVKKEQAYFFPVSRLAPFLKKLRDKKALFAVEEGASERLREGAELRASLLRDGAKPSATELETSLLVPYLEKHGSRYKLCSYTNEHLQLLFCELSTFAERKRMAESFDEDALLGLLARASSQGVFLYKTKEVLELLDGKRESFSALVKKHPADFPLEILSCYTPPIFWHASGEGLKSEVGLYIQKSLFLEHEQLAAFKSAERSSPAAFLSHYLLGKKSLEFLSFYRDVQSSFPGVIPSSELFSFHLKKLEAQAGLFSRRNYFQNLKDCADVLLDKELEQKLFAHQRVAVSWLKENSQAFLGDDMGLGKTLSVLACFSELKARGELDFLLVICPNSLSRNWKKEAEAWVPACSFALLAQTKKEREAELLAILSGEKKVDALVINFETARLDYVLLELVKILEQKRAMLCVDESQRAKNPQSKTFGALSALSGLSARRVLLSGTPIPKDLSDIWAQIYLLDLGERFGENYYDWLEQIAVLGNDYSEYAIKSYKKQEAELAILRAQELLLRRKKENVVDLPSKIFSERYVELKGEQKKRYEEVRESLLLRLSSVDGKTYTKEIHSILEEYLRAVQIASNPRLVDEHWKGEPLKFLELDEIVEEVVRENERKLVVWSSYVKNTEELALRYAKYGARAFNGKLKREERAEIVAEFQREDSGLRILVANPAAGGVGITLTAADTAVYMDRTWNAEHWMQSVDRLHRIGQKKSVQIIALNSCPIDYLIERNLAKKERLQRQLLDESAEGLDLECLPTREELLSAVRK